MGMIVSVYRSFQENDDFLEVTDCTNGGVTNCETGVHQHQIVAVLEHTGVLADLMQTPQRNHLQAGFLRLAGSCVVRHEGNCRKLVCVSR